MCLFSDRGVTGKSLNIDQLLLTVCVGMQTSKILSHHDTWLSGVDQRFIFFLAYMTGYNNPIQRRKAATLWIEKDFEGILQKFVMDVGSEHLYSLKYLSSKLYLNCFVPEPQAHALINTYQFHLLQIFAKLPSQYANLKIHLKKSFVSIFN